ncbi:hypothetical protein HEK616_79320 (plasmid) [Streptomyces nigrescens]|uniref:Terpene synthase n=2 Tax=Streptomyces TaxID=1883 RepID=A0ABM8A755_STRNI|nr:terpene synthase family protein [Streptomyces nigrescens]MEE4418849.1 terpene synthase family protein [Streptomyces sp. DSM 41528]BDM74445.1 hypothetical protein HEK616_79320 [Streptomyces nigrescens]
MTAGDRTHPEGVALDLPLGGTILPLDRVNPQHAHLRAQHDQWFAERLIGRRRDKVLDQIKRHDMIGLATRAAPSADTGYLLDAALFTTTGFIVDDVLEDPETSPLLIDAYLAVADESDMTVESEDLRLWADSLTQARAHLTPGQKARHCRGLSEWVRCHAGRGRQLEHTRDLSSYLDFRRTDSGFTFLTVGVERSIGVDLEQVTYSPDLERLHAACLAHGTLVNDLFSYRKERDAPVPMNAVHVLQRTEGLTLQGAVDKVCGLIREAERDVDRLLRVWKEADGAAQALYAYAHAWWELLGGHLRWTLESERYHGRGHVWDGTVPTAMVLYPDRTVLLAA